jgi:hypothetical protein
LEAGIHQPPGRSRSDNVIGSLGSRLVFIQFNILAVKLTHIHANAIKGIHRACKTILAVFSDGECLFLTEHGHRV